MATSSAVPAWSVMAEELFPDYANCLDGAPAPLTLTARLIKNTIRMRRLSLSDSVRQKEKNWKPCRSVRSGGLHSDV